MSKFTIDAILGVSNDSLKKKTTCPTVTSKPRSRRGRTAFSDDAVDRLESVFMVNRYPDITLRETLAQQLGVAESRIQVWFQNRRSRGKRSKPRSRDSSIVSSESRINEELERFSHYQASHQPHNLVYNQPYPYHTTGYHMPIIPQMNYYSMPSYGFPIMPHSGYAYSPIQHGTFNSPIPVAHQFMVHQQVTPNVSPSIKANLQGINMLTEAARKLSSSSFTEYDLRHPESLNDTTIGSSTSIRSEESMAADTSRSSISSIPSDTSSNVSCTGEEESDDEDQLFIDI